MLNRFQCEAGYGWSSLGGEFGQAIPVDNETYWQIVKELPPTSFNSFRHIAQLHLARALGVGPDVRITRGGWPW